MIEGTTTIAGTAIDGAITSRTSVHRVDTNTAAIIATGVASIISDFSPS